MRSTKAVLLLFALSLGAHVPLAGQSGEGVAEGSRIRFSIVTRPPGTYFVGSIVSLRQDSMWVAVEHPRIAADSVLAVPVNLVDYIAIPAGWRNRAALGAAIGTAVGVIGGAAAGFAAGDTRSCALVTTTSGVLPVGPCTGSSAEKKGAIGAAIGAVAGAGLGFGVGSVVKVFTWNETWIEGMRIAMIPILRKRFEISVFLTM